jgi:hypothetical protein
VLFVLVEPPASVLGPVRNSDLLKWSFTVAKTGIPASHHRLCLSIHVSPFEIIVLPSGAIASSYFTDLGLAEVWMQSIYRKSYPLILF